MGLYGRYVLPKLVNWACRQGPPMQQRARLIPAAEGKVLEIGIGSGLNLGFYDAKKVQSVVGIDPSEATWRQHDIDLHSLPFAFEFIAAPAESIPVEDGIFDTIVTTYTLCTIPDYEQAFAEFRRVLKPGGQLLFCEHGRAPDTGVAKWQDRINPIWKKFGGGCNLNRNIPALIRENGFQITDLETLYLPGWKPATFNFRGRARL
ncbi:class I SAM-dependent methyltransferase [Flavilitoribacter nigricans]|uniref:SAM-dependent methyltransferase n=1 Tax=Flavilitoribacter nigricans (strain ATCC 23147 / DSM 23189 / NBRC 102662 / NCIMB 1420 / SS-2) TaxID=1122177 RepID=A0A2D0N3Y3_FLAN2|nr:class I SAM-dependent methyltransferase [Flavilitoribacter nigricans]PHN03231.1 SAM-dependent methyltransferase [Flavilitoribacter nigricans DSM 23189 = NBRC 102662]